MHEAANALSELGKIGFNFDLTPFIFINRKIANSCFPIVPRRYKQILVRNSYGQLTERVMPA